MNHPSLSPIFIRERDNSVLQKRLDALKLEVPVGLYLTDHNTILLVRNGITEERELPTKPFKMLKAYIGAGEADTGVVEDIYSETVTEIGTGYPLTIQRREYPSVPLKPSKNDKGMTPTLDYVESLIHEFPDLIPSLVKNETVLPYYQGMDIETWGKTGNGFNPKVAEVVSIQVSFPDTPIYVMTRTDFPDERDLIVAYLSLCMKSPSGKQPDLVIGYNHSGFDFPFLYGRSTILGITDKWMEVSRTRNSYIDSVTYGGVFYPNAIRPETDRHIIHVAPGLVLFDIYHHVKTDQAKDVKSLPSKKLENVAAVYGMKDVFDLEGHEKANMMGLLRENPERFVEYGASDIEKVELLFLDIYGPRVTAMSNLLSSPFVQTSYMSSGEIATIPLYRECRKNGYLSTTKNDERYQDIVEMGKYQGAIVECFKTGYFDDIIYLDASAMYPTIMEDLNVSYDVNRLVRYVPMDEAPDIYPGITNFNVIHSWGPVDNRTILVPDENLQIILEYAVNLESPGFLVSLIRHYKSIRKAYKKKSQEAKKKHKETGDEIYELEYKQYDAIQQACKIINNTFYGLQGDKRKIIADYPLGLFITGIGRWLMQQMIELAKDSILESDTDGIIIERSKFKYGIEEINSIIKDRMVDLFGLKKDDIGFELEFEGGGALYLYKMKTYIYLERDAKNPVIKGSAFHGYNKAQVIKDAVNILAATVMKQPYQGKVLSFQEAKAICLDLRTRPIEDFFFHMSVKKEISSYKGFADIGIFSSAIDKTGSMKSRLSDIRKRARTWVDKNIPSNLDKKRFKEMISSATSESEISFIIDTIRHASGKNPSASNETLTLIMKRINMGYDVSIGDEITYMYSRGTDKLKLIEEIESVTEIDYERYYDDINRVIERFSLADEKQVSRNLF